MLINCRRDNFCLEKASLLVDHHSESIEPWNPGIWSNFQETGSIMVASSLQSQLKSWLFLLISSPLVQWVEYPEVLGVKLLIQVRFLSGILLCFTLASFKVLITILVTRVIVKILEADLFNIIPAWQFLSGNTFHFGRFFSFLAPQKKLQTIPIERVPIRVPIDTGNIGTRIKLMNR